MTVLSKTVTSLKLLSVNRVRESKDYFVFETGFVIDQFNNLVTTIPVGTGPNEIVFNPSNGEPYIANIGDSTRD